LARHPVGAYAGGEGDGVGAWSSWKGVYVGAVPTGFGGEWREDDAIFAIGRGCGVTQLVVGGIGGWVRFYRDIGQVIGFGSVGGYGCDGSRREGQGGGIHREGVERGLVQTRTCIGIEGTGGSSLTIWTLDRIGFGVAR